VSVTDFPQREAVPPFRTGCVPTQSSPEFQQLRSRLRRFVTACVCESAVGREMVRKMTTAVVWVVLALIPVAGVAPVGGVAHADSADDQFPAKLSSQGIGAAPDQLIAIGHETRAWKDQGRFEIGIDQHSNPVAVIGEHLNAAVPKLRDLRPDLAGFDLTLSTALAKNPDQRFSGCRDFAKAPREHVAAAPLGEHTTQAAAAAAAPNAAPISAGAHTDAGRRPRNSVVHTFVSALIGVALIGAIMTLTMLFGDRRVFGGRREMFGGRRENRSAARSVGRCGPTCRQRSRQLYVATPRRLADGEAIRHGIQDAEQGFAVADLAVA
jgi:hypothetical protein